MVILISIIMITNITNYIITTITTYDNDRSHYNIISQ